MGVWDFINNTWFVSIVGGLVVTAASGIATRIFLSRREAKEYQRTLDLANADIVRAVRPSISENALPPRAVIKSVIAATSRKHGVDQKDAYGIPEVVDELVNEVMASSFISAQTKVNYCAALAELKTVPTSEMPKPGPSKGTKPATRNTREIELLTSTVTVLVAGMSGVTFIILVPRLSDGILALAQSATISLAIPLIAMAVTMTLLIPGLLRALRGTANRGAKSKEERRDSRAVDPPTIGTDGDGKQIPEAATNVEVKP